MAEKAAAAPNSSTAGTAEAGGEAEVNLDLILDVGVTLALEVGRTRIKVRDLLQLSQGSILELDRLSGEPLDVLVNGVRVARGEVVVVNDSFGVRLTEVVSPRERMEPLR
jgi:flagellar motor switch protein FliN/FliY